MKYRYRVTAWVVDNSKPVADMTLINSADAAITAARGLYDSMIGIAEWCYHERYAKTSEHDFKGIRKTSCPRVTLTDSLRRFCVQIEKTPR